MTPKRVRKLAQQAGAGDLGLSVGSVFVQGLFERFADLVAAEVREECAAWVEQQRNDIPAYGFEFAAAIRSLGKKEAA